MSSFNAINSIGFDICNSSKYWMWWQGGGWWFFKKERVVKIYHRYTWSTYNFCDKHDYDRKWIMPPVLCQLATEEEKSERWRNLRVWHQYQWGGDYDSISSELRHLFVFLTYLNFIFDFCCQPGDRHDMSSPGHMWTSKGQTPAGAEKISSPITRSPIRKDKINKRKAYKSI